MNAFGLLEVNLQPHQWDIVIGGLRYAATQSGVPENQRAYGNVAEYIEKQLPPTETKYREMAELKLARLADDARVDHDAPLSDADGGRWVRAEIWVGDGDFE